MGNVAVQNTTASLSGKTLAKLEDNQTFTGQKTFDIGASAPFVCVAGAAKVDNLDADKLDGQEGTAYHDAAQLTGVLPVTVVGADPNADRIVFWDDSANKYDFLALTGLAIRTTGLVLPRTIPNGRLTLTSGTPVTTADVTAAAMLYYALYDGNQIPLYNGTAWEMFVIAELSIAAPAFANQVYDVFVQYNAGTPQLALVAWTNDTTRATALTTQDGVLVKTGATGDRYVGTVRTKTASQFNDSYAFRHVWNYYNRVNRPCRNVTETTNTWDYNTAAYRQANAAAGNQLDVVVGVAEDQISVVVQAMGFNSTGGVIFGVSIGEDSTTTPATTAFHGAAQPAAGIYTLLQSHLVTIPAIGRHVYVWLEYSGATITTTFFGDNGSPTLYQSGIQGNWRA